jgi:hypothetical protein
MFWIASTVWVGRVKVPCAVMVIGELPNSQSKLSTVMCVGTIEVVVEGGIGGGAAIAGAMMMSSWYEIRSLP